MQDDFFGGGRWAQEQTEETEKEYMKRLDVPVGLLTRAPRGYVAAL